MAGADQGDVPEGGRLGGQAGKGPAGGRRREEADERHAEGARPARAPGKSRHRSRQLVAAAAGEPVARPRLPAGGSLAAPPRGGPGSPKSLGRPGIRSGHSPPGLARHQFRRPIGQAVAVGLAEIGRRRRSAGGPARRPGPAPLPGCGAGADRHPARRRRRLAGGAGAGRVRIRRDSALHAGPARRRTGAGGGAGGRRAAGAPGGAGGRRRRRGDRFGGSVR